MKDCCGDGTLGAIIPQVSCPNYRNVWQVWQGPLAGGDLVVVLVNRFETEQDIQLDWAQDAQVPPGTYTVRADPPHEFEIHGFHANLRGNVEVVFHFF